VVSLVRKNSTTSDNHFSVPFSQINGDQSRLSIHTAHIDDTPKFSKQD
jgi:hypothetical protein